MANLAKLKFVALNISGKNYLSWVLDAEIHLQATNLGNAIKEGNNASQQDRAKAMIFLRHHIHAGLKEEYLTVKDPLELWKALEERYAQQKTMILPRARVEWTHLRLQDYKTVREYNSALFKISSQMRLCGEPISDEMLLEKTFSTFHASNMLLQQQYRERGFKKYSELISCLLVAEQNNELLMKNHQSRPTGSQPFPEVNATFSGGNGNGRGGRHENYHVHGRRRGRGRQNGQGRGNHTKHLGPRNNAKVNKGKGQMKQAPQTHDNICHRCGGNNHWARTCRTPKHLADLYKASLKGKNVETNYVVQSDPWGSTESMDITSLEMSSLKEKNMEATYVDHSDPWDSSEPMDITSLDMSDFFVNNGSHVDEMISGGVLDTN